MRCIIREGYIFGHIGEDRICRNLGNIIKNTAMKINFKLCFLLDRKLRSPSSKNAQRGCVQMHNDICCFATAFVMLSAFYAQEHRKEDVSNAPLVL